MSDGKTRLTFSQLSALALVQSPLAAILLPVAVFLPPLYAGELGLGVVLVGQIIAIARLWDVVTDPIMGFISDRFPTRFGRRRHWILLGTPLLLGAAFLIYNPTFMFETMTGGRFLLLLFVMYAGWTMVTINHFSWASEVNPTYHDRSRLQGALQIFSLFGIITVLMIPLLTERLLGADRLEQVAAIGWFLVFLLPVAVIGAVLFVPEVKPEIVDVNKEENPKFMETLRVIVGNRPLRRILIVYMLEGISVGLLSSLFVFFTIEALGLGPIGNALLLVYFMVGALCTPIWVQLSYKFGKRKTFLITVAYSLIALPALLLVPYGNFGIAFAAFLFFGIGAGAQQFIARSILGDIVDLDTYNSGKQRTGLLFSMLTLIQKAGIAIAILVGYSFLLPLIGFEADTENSASAILGLKIIFVAVPMLINFAIFRLMWDFPMDEDHQLKIRAALDSQA